MFDFIFFIIMLALALAMDAFAVSISLGISLIYKKKVQDLKVAFTFGFFQMIMFVFGFYSLFLIGDKFSFINKYIAALLLLVLGFNMAKEVFSKNKNECEHNECLGKLCKRNRCLKTKLYRLLTFKLLITFALATSIDSFAAGVSYGLIYKNIILASSLIGLITLFLSYIGISFGYKLKNLVGDKANLVGGIILIILAIKSLF